MSTSHRNFLIHLHRSSESRKPQMNRGSNTLRDRSGHTAMAMRLTISGFLQTSACCFFFVVFFLSRPSSG
ncbi:hypothetical protein CEXT_452461 [Caerostris extrusa]|uniref:Transmembrane protein n=1 Tax=Caerostris extrusa TaxID=172846 RepID=A0AAV4XYH2_CAEEX|nr:hypothetical protein CEXT_452461 [Caerostris extrusa]